MGCPQNNSASSVALHTSSLSPNSFFLSLTSTSICNLLQLFCALLDSGSSHSFVNEAFATNNKLKFSYLPNPIPLKMFDGSTPSNVSKKVWMPITFSTGEMHHLEFFVTNLDENYSLVLGYDWLAQHNLNIDWTETKIMFREPKNPKKELASSRKIDICMVRAVTMTKLCKDPGTSTFVISMTDLNRVTEKDCYPLPLILDLLTSPAPTRIYSKIDLKHAYHLVHIAKGDKPKTAFCTHYSSYKWQVMPFRLSNVPAAFQRFINEVLRDLMDICTVGYLDNVLIYSDSLEDHQDHICCRQDNNLHMEPTYSAQFQGLESSIKVSSNATFFYP